MKINIEVNQKEARLLLGGLKKIAGSTNNKETLKSISKLIREIEQDVKMDEIVFRRLEHYTKKYRSKYAKFERESDLRSDLKMGNPFLNSNQGFFILCNHLLKNIILKYKPGKAIVRVVLADLRKCGTVKDVMDVIIAGYEKA